MEPQVGILWSLGKSTPRVLGTVKEGAFPCHFLPAALQDKQRAIFSKSLVSLLRVVRALTQRFSSCPLSCLLAYFKTSFYFEKEIKRNSFPSRYLPTHLVFLVPVAASREWKGALKTASFTDKCVSPPARRGSEELALSHGSPGRSPSKASVAPWTAIAVMWEIVH